MLNIWKNLRHETAALTLPPSPPELHLHAMISGLGFSKETSITYDWHGLRRGDGEFALLQYTVSGRGRLQYEEKSFDVLPGQAMILHFPYDNHYWLPENSKHWEFLYICLYGWEIMQLWSMYERLAGPLVSLDANSETVQLGFMIYESISKGRVSSPFAASEFAYRLAMCLGKEIVPLSEKRSNSNFESVKLYCKFNLHKSITVEQMALVAGMSQYHFSRLFKQAEGISPAAYIEQLQMDRARELLCNTLHSIKEIADACGFDDPSYFTKAFKRSEGTTPLRYRKSHLS